MEAFLRVAGASVFAWFFAFAVMTALFASLKFVNEIALVLLLTISIIAAFGAGAYSYREESRRKRYSWNWMT